MTAPDKPVMVTRDTLAAALCHPAVTGTLRMLEQQGGGPEDLARAIMKALHEGEPADMLTPSEVAAMFRVDAKTVARWRQQGKIKSFTTPGGHGRFHRADVETFLGERQARQGREAS